MSTIGILYKNGNFKEFNPFYPRSASIYEKTPIKSSKKPIYGVLEGIELNIERMTKEGLICKMFYKDESIYNGKGIGIVATLPLVDIENVSEIDSIFINSQQIYPSTTHTIKATSRER